MQDSTESKPEQYRLGAAAGLLPLPRTLGSFAILITILAFLAGRIRNELALTLLGTIFLIILIYCFCGVLLLGILNRGKAQSLALVIANDTLAVGENAELLIKASSGAAGGGHSFHRLPAILTRCELILKTKDDRIIRYYADPGSKNLNIIPVKERGAYYSSSCEHCGLIIFDGPGFFHLSLPLRQNEELGLLAFPKASEEIIPLSLSSSGSERRNELNYRSSNEFSDHRPYVPGDDPRRINWKLYSHAPLGELLVREPVPLPLPRSRLTILIDTEADRSLYTLEESRQAVDLLCENALAAALEFSALGMDLQIGCTGGRISGAEEGGFLNTAGLAAALAWPAAIPLDPKADSESPGVGLPGPNLLKAELPRAPEDVLILALPRTILPGAGSPITALDRFLKNHKREADIIFIYNSAGQGAEGASKAARLEEAARACAGFYHKREKT